MRGVVLLCGVLGAVLCAALTPAADRPARLQPPPGFQAVPAMPDNALTAERIELGKRLFNDTLLSADHTVSCRNCHQPEHGFTVPERFGRGIGGALTPRRPSTLINRAWGAFQFWDGRAASLEDLTLQPIQHPQEMGLTLDELESRLRADADYRQMFLRHYGAEPNRADVSRALAAFLRSVISEPSGFTRFMSGDTRALSEAAQRGYDLFHGKARCGSCHWEPNLTDEGFHNTGIAARQPVFDRGRGGGLFKTPTLHNVSRRAPYMHDGGFPDLESVVDYYDRGGQPVKAGTVLTRQGDRWKPGINVIGRTLLTAACDGEIYFTHKVGKYTLPITVVNVRPSTDGKKK